MQVGGNTPCVELRFDDHIYIFDAGTGIIPLGNELMRQDQVRELSIVLSHYHWDHISGLPFFVPAFVPGWKIDFYGPAENPDTLANHLAAQMKAPYFPVETETWLADISYHTPSTTFQIGPMQLNQHTMHHPGLTYAYRMNIGDKTVVYAPDNELSFISQSIENRLFEFDEDERQLLEEMKEEQKWRGIEFMDCCDVLVHDAQYTPEDYQRKRGWGHSCYIDTVNSAIDARCKELLLFSHDPGYDDAQLGALERQAVRLVEQRGSLMRCRAAREGMVINL